MGHYHKVSTEANYSNSAVNNKAIDAKLTNEAPWDGGEEDNWMMKLQVPCERFREVIVAKPWKLQANSS